MVDETYELFLQEMSDVKPMVKLDTVFLQTDTLSQRRQKLIAYQFTEQLNKLTIDKQQIPLLAGDDLIFSKSPGLQAGVFKNLRLAKYDIEAQLDLTGTELKTARFDLVSFIEDCYHANIRCVLVRHGTGKKSGTATLKSALKLWLDNYDKVQAYHSAPMKLGGYGSTLVLIAKNEKQKLENRERHKRG